MILPERRDSSTKQVAKPMRLYLHSLHSVQSRLRQEPVVTVQRQRMSNKVNGIGISSELAVPQFTWSVVEHEKGDSQNHELVTTQTLWNLSLVLTTARGHSRSRVQNAWG